MQRSRLHTALAATTLAAASFAGIAPGASASPPAPKVTICHATASHSNPYVRVSVARDSVDGDLGTGHGNGDHLAEHTGAIGPVDHGAWGDIIPAIPGVHGGLNWDAAGQATWANGCVPTDGGGAYEPPDY